MKTTKLWLFVAMITISLSAFGQSAQQVLDKTAATIGRKGGASASFKLDGGKQGAVSGTIAIKGNKFFANTPQAKVWFDGKTQWAYLTRTDEVNISTPTQAEQMAMNPYTFINIYKSGYNATMRTVGAAYEVHLTAQNQKRTVQELYITISKSYLPTLVKMRQGKNWTTIHISNFKAKNQPDGTFKFNKSLCPTAEIIDLR